LSVATDPDGSALIIGEATMGSPALEPSRSVVASWHVTLKSIGYWAAWIAFGAWALQCDHYYLMNGWWMVLLFFWLTANNVQPAHNAPRGFKWLSIGAATVAAAFLVYDTFEWLEKIVDGWSWGPPGQWLRLVAMLIRAIAASVLTGIVLVPQLRRHLGPYAVPLLLAAGLSVGIYDFGGALITAVHWREHWKASCIELFMVIILPLVLAAISERIKPLPSGAIFGAISRLWRGEVPTWAVLVIVYPLTIIGVFWLDERYKDLPNQGYSNWEYANRRAIEWVLLVVLLLVGSRITWRCLSRIAKSGRRISRWLQVIVLLIASPFLLVTVLGDGFTVGHIITQSARAALGSAYDIQVPNQGVELRFAGDVTYGLTDRLIKVLDANPGVSRIRLESGGGTTDEALRAAKLIAARKLDTVVSGECASSCTDLFMAGKHRMLEKGGRLGFHAAITADPTEDAGGYFRMVYSPYGVDKGFIARVESTRPSGMWYPTREELVSGHILTAGD
jgi:hypothetical protein